MAKDESTGYPDRGGPVEPETSERGQGKPASPDRMHPNQDDRNRQDDSGLRKEDRLDNPE